MIKDMNQSKTNEHQSIIDSHINNPNQYTIHHRKNNPYPPREGGRRRRWERPGKSTFLYPSSALVENFTQGEGFFTLREAVDSATPGKPFVQNDMREG